MGLIEEFADLFAGNPNAYGLVHGECVKTTVDRNVWAEHLYGETPIGVYPLREFDTTTRAWWADKHNGLDGGRFYVKWGCTDIDNAAVPEACWPLARNMSKALDALGISAWIEKSKGKGFHVWVFADEWVPAIVMRRALLAAHQVAGVAPTEVNPKQVDTSTLKVGLGNYVNLPYPNGWDMGGDASPRRCVLGVDEDWNAYLPSSFVDVAADRRNGFGVLRDAALLYKEPPKRSVGSYTEPDAAASELSTKLNGLGYTIWKHGVLEGRDRSGTLVRLAHLMAEGGEIEPGEAMVLLRDADVRWGKWSERADCEEQLGKIIDRAYSKIRDNRS